MRRDMQRSWKWLLIGRLVVLLAFTPEVRTAELASSEQRSPNPEGVAAKPNIAFIARAPIRRDVGIRLAILPKKQGSTLSAGGRF